MSGGMNAPSGGGSSVSNYGNTGNINAVSPTTSAKSAANPYLGMNNPYLQKNIDAVNADVSRQYRNTVMPAQVGANVSSGSFGNSGLQQMQLEDQRNLQNTLANNSANMRMQDYNQQQNMYQWQQGQNLARENQAFNQGMGINQNNYGQNMGWANYGLNADNQRFNQNMARNQFDANQYWTGQNFDAGRYDRTFDQNQTQFNNYLNLMGQTNGYNQQDITNSTNLYNTPLNYQQIFSGLANSFGGNGGSSSQSMPGNQFLGAVGGGMAGSRLGGNK